MRKPLSVIPVIHIYEIQKHHLLNLLTLHAYSGKDRDNQQKRLPVEICIMGRVFKWLHLEETCFGGCLFIRDFFPKLNTTLSQKRTTLLDSFARVSLPLKAVVREETGPHLATILSPSYDLTLILTISCLFISLFLPLISPSHLLSGLEYICSSVSDAIWCKAHSGSVWKVN